VKLTDPQRNFVPGSLKRRNITDLYNSRPRILKKERKKERIILGV
jgi:hypothetical protein